MGRDGGYRKSYVYFLIMQTHGYTASSATEENSMWMEVLSKYLEHLVLEHPLVRIIGLGFGHQLVARAFGGKVVQDKHHAEFGITKFKLTNEGTDILSPFDHDTEWVRSLHRMGPRLRPQFSAKSNILTHFTVFTASAHGLCM